MKEFKLQTNCRLTRSAHRQSSKPYLYAQRKGPPLTCKPADYHCQAFVTFNAVRIAHCCQHQKPLSRQSSAHNHAWLHMLALYPAHLNNPLLTCNRESACEQTSPLPSPFSPPESKAPCNALSKELQGGWNRVRKKGGIQSPVEFMQSLVIELWAFNQTLR